MGFNIGVCVYIDMCIIIYIVLYYIYNLDI